MNMSDLAEAEQALSFVSSDDRDTWVKMGMALRSAFGEEAFDVWDRWSQRSESYRASSAKSTWRSFGGGNIRIASLFHVAQEAGWRKSGVETWPVSSGEMAERKEAVRKRTQEANAKKDIDHRLAAERAIDMIARASLGNHPYLKSKQFPDELGFITQDNSLMVPMRNSRKKLVGAQIICWEGDQWVKKFIYGTKAQGAIFRIGSRSAAYSILCEGYATGLTIYKACRLISLDVTILVCFSASNIIEVSKFVTCKHCGIYADNDENRAGEKAALKTGRAYIMSNTVGFDASDDLREHSIIHVAEKCRQLITNMGI